MRRILPRAILSFAAMVALSAGGMGCSQGTADTSGVQSMPPKTIEQVLKEHTDELMEIPGVVATAQGLSDDKPCIKVFVVKKTPELEQKIPKRLGDFPVVLEASGEIRARPENQE